MSLFDKLKGKANQQVDQFESEETFLTDNVYGYLQVKPKPININEILKIHPENYFALNNATVRHPASGEQFILKVLKLSKNESEIYVELNHGEVNRKCQTITYGPNGRKDVGMINYGMYQSAEGAIFNLRTNTLHKLGYTIDFGEVQQLGEIADWLIQALITSNAKGEELEKGIITRFTSYGKQVDFNGHKIVHNNAGGWDFIRKGADGADVALPIASLITSLAVMDPTYVMNRG